MRTIKINLQGYTRIPEGIKDLTIESAKATPSGDPKKIEIVFVDKLSGGKLTHKVNLDNNTSVYIFSLIVSYTLGLSDGADFDVINDTPKLVGKSIKAEVKHVEGTQPREDGTLPIFVNLGRIIGPVDETLPQHTHNTDVSPRQAIIDDL